MGERVAILETEMAETREALKMYTAATQAFTEAVRALNSTISKSHEPSPRGGGLRDWRFLAILAVASAGGGGTAKLLDFIVKAMGGP